MTYFGFLVIFLLIPIGILLVVNRPFQPRQLTWIGILMGVALLYTTPWDNYLVATRVWWYDPALVTGITIGWVPIEEYTFFLLQPLMTGLWIILLNKRMADNIAPVKGKQQIRWISLGAVGLIWITSVWLLVTNNQPGRYLALELAWALPPILLQLGFGADILARRWKLVLASLIPPTLYLAAADALAIQSGTWTINPDLSTGILIGGVLPIEELIFFFLTNALVTGGMILLLDEHSHERLRTWASRIRGRKLNSSQPSTP